MCSHKNMCLAHILKKLRILSFGGHLGRHLEYFNFPNDAKVASFSFNVRTYWRTHLCKNILCGLFFGVAPKIFIWQPDYYQSLKGVSDGAMVLGKLPVSGHLTNLDWSRARAYCACSRCGWGLFGHFFSRLSFFLLSPSLWETARYRLKFLLVFFCHCVL